MIATFTDFGIGGPYLGQMKAVLHRDAPGVPVVDIVQDLPPFNVKAAAYLIPAYSRYLPDDTVCLAIVDPGVGCERRALAVHADRHWFVGPDNGLLAIIIRHAADVQAYEITWRPGQLSNSFHGRDLFAPVAAKLAQGEQSPGQPVQPAALTLPQWPDDLAEIIYVDGYGNCITGLRACAITKQTILEVAGSACEFKRTFGEAQPGIPFWYENSNGLVEIALNQGQAAPQLGLVIGSEFTVIT